MAKIKILTTRQITTVPSGFHPDGGNLYLRVRDTGSRSWVFRYKIAGKVIELGLGPIANRSLSQARDLAARMRTLVFSLLNPLRRVFLCNTKFIPDNGILTLSFLSSFKE